MSANVTKTVALQILGGTGVISIPIGLWWYQATSERKATTEKFNDRPLALTNDTYDYLIAEKCQPGDVVLFDRRCER